MGKEAFVDPIEAAQRDVNKGPVPFGGVNFWADALCVHIGKLVAHHKDADAEGRRLLGAAVCWLQEPRDEQRQQELARLLAKGTGGHAGDYLRMIKAIVNGKVVDR